jgi:DNA-binding NarL/FixJ family response regulator
VTLPRIGLIGTADERQRLRRRLGAFVEVVGEFATLAAGRAAAPDVDAFLVAPERSPVRSENEPATEMVEPVTPRELDVLRLLALGLPNKTIAARLDISDQTVKFHVASIIGKLGAANRTDAVRRALRRGLVDL